MRKLQRYAIILATTWGISLLLSACGPGVNSADKGQQPIDYSPAADLNVFRNAIVRGDVVTAEKFYFLPADTDGSCRRSLAQSQIAQNQFYKSIDVCFGRSAAVQIGSRMSSFIGEPLPEYTSHDFQMTGNPNFAYGRIGTQGAWRPLVRGPEGIWQINEDIGSNPEQLKAFTAYEEKRIAMYKDLTLKVTEKRFHDLSEVEEAIITASRMLAQSNTRGSAKAMPPKGIAAESFDRGTIQGAIEAYEQAFEARDKFELFNFFYCENDPYGKVAAANTQRILVVLQLKDAIDLKFKGRGESFVMDDTRLFGAPDLIWWCSVEKQEGDNALGVFEDNSHVSFRRINSVWKLDLTPSTPIAPSELAKRIKKEFRILDGIRLDILAGKYQQISQVRDVVISAKSAAN